MTFLVRAQLGTVEPLGTDTCLIRTPLFFIYYNNKTHTGVTTVKLEL